MASNQIMLQSEEADKSYQVFSLKIKHPNVDIALLSDEQELIINTNSGTFVVVNWEQRSFLTDGVLSEPELALLLALLHAWPSYIENQKLLQAIMHLSVEEVAQLLSVESETALEPLHHLVNDCRVLVQQFGVEIHNVNSQGYKLGRKEPQL
jgi:hypothetical protein